MKNNIENTFIDLPISVNKTKLPSNNLNNSITTEPKKLKKINLYGKPKVHEHDKLPNLYDSVVIEKTKFLGNVN